MPLMNFPLTYSPPPTVRLIADSNGNKVIFV